MREKWRQRQEGGLLVYVPNAQVRQAPGDAAEKQPQPICQAGGVDPRNPAASPRAEDGASDRNAQPPEKGKSRAVVSSDRT